MNYHSRDSSKIQRMFQTGSLQKIQEIGQQHYKKAMKHMQKFNQYQKKIKQSKEKQQLNHEDNQQCTFKPKLFKNKYNNSINRMGRVDNKYNDSKEKDKKNINININKNKYSIKQSQRKKLIKSSQNQNRLLAWGIKRDQKKIQKVIVNKINQQKEMSMSFRQGSSLSKSISKSKQKQRYDRFQEPFLKSHLNRSLDYTTNTSISHNKSTSFYNSSYRKNTNLNIKVPGTNSFYQRQAKAKALKQQKLIKFKDDSYSMLF